MGSQLDLFGVAEKPPRAASPPTSFVPNQRLPVHRWFRYSAGFSGAWAERLIRETTRPGAVVLDPFAGVATTLVAAQMAGRSAVGIEAQPFVLRLAECKLLWTFDADRFESAASRALEVAARLPRVESRAKLPLLVSAYSEPALADLRRLERAIVHESAEGSQERRLLWLALVSILRACSGAGTAPWQYVLPKKKKARVAEPFEKLRTQVALMAEDMRASSLARQGAPPDARVARGDARDCAAIEPDSVDFVLTSPPYPNNYDYADATRLEQTFLGEVQGWGDLHEASRKYLVRACSQHTAKEGLRLEALLADESIAPIRAALQPVCARLAEVRETRGGKKTYHTMIAAYFADMARVWRALARVARPGAEVCFVVGDSAPYGVYVPVDVWLRELAEAAGFSFAEFREVRKRNTKWKNRKHRVPLKEGELWMAKRLG